MKRVNVNLYPRGGYLFVDKDGAKLRSDKGWRDLIARVTDYRRRNKYPIGDPEQEVHEQACVSNPSYCSDQTVVIPQPGPKSTMKERILRWIVVLRTKASELRFVTETEAMVRAEICLKCPRRQSLPVGCSSCRAAVKAARPEIIGKRKIDERLNGFGCDAVGVDIATAAHIDGQTVEDETLPSFCWMKRQKK